MNKQKKSRISLKISKKRIAVFAIVFCLIIASLPFYSFFGSVINSSPKWNGEGLQVSFIDVGHGDAIFANLPNGKILLIDSGSKINSYGKKRFEKTLSKEMKGKDTIDIVVLTHNHEDHYGNMQYVFENYNVAKFYYPLSAMLNIDYASEVSSEIPVPMNYIIETEELKIQVLMAKANYPAESDSNSSSIVILIEYLSKKFLFMGDAEADIEEKYVETLAQYVGKCDVLKVGHHGSSTSSTENFIAEVSPNISVISAGKGAQNSRPSEEVLKRIKDEGSKIYRTDKNGTVKLFVNSYSVNSIALGIGAVLQKGSGEISWFFVCSVGFIVLFVLVFEPRFKRKISA